MFVDAPRCLYLVLYRRSAAFSPLALLFCVLLPLSAASPMELEFDIPADDAVSALRLFATQSRRQVIYSGSAAAFRRARPDLAGTAGFQGWLIDKVGHPGDLDALLELALGHYALFDGLVRELSAVYEDCTDDELALVTGWVERVTAAQQRATASLQEPS